MPQPTQHEFHAVVQRDGDWYVGWSSQIPGANGQGRTVKDSRANLADAISLVLQDKAEDGMQGALRQL